jgi:CrcB protein
LGAYDLVLAFIGGGIGSLLRWGVGLALSARFRGKFPPATFLINVTGCFLIGFLSVLFTVDWKDRYGTLLNTAVLTGILGGYTTFSSMQIEADSLIREGERRLALGYLLASIAAGLAAAALGGGLARLFLIEGAMLNKVILIFFGGAVGAATREFLMLSVGGGFPEDFPPRCCSRIWWRRS